MDKKQMIWSDQEFFYKKIREYIYIKFHLQNHPEE